MRVVIASDHGGYELKQALVPLIRELGHEVVDYGTHTPDPVDYPDFAVLVGCAVVRSPRDTVGIMIDGAGTGSAITANKIPGVRAAACYDPFTARNSREHNNANVLTLGSRVTGLELAKEVVRAWLGSAFQGERHARRVDKILNVERCYMKEPTCS
ncbi:MAG: ribose 5-phosphate isomerase B [Candidatus Eremiobacterota bacterium]